MMRVTSFVLLFALVCAKVEGQESFASNVQCQTDYDCLNNGSCQQSSAGVRYCQCPNGFGGQDCSATCTRNCQNGGSCRYHQDITHGSDQDGNTYCECADGFLGVNCEIPFTVCPDAELKCLHGGTCVAKATNPSSFRCDCPGRRTGDVCEYDSPEDPRIREFHCRADTDCLNGGACVNDGSQNVCQCKSGFGGEDCSQRCARDCQNGGSCRYHKDISHGSDQDGDTFCHCIGSFLGVNCEIPFVQCRGDVRCLHGGICWQQSKGVDTCNCPFPRTGDVCQFNSEHDPRISTDKNKQANEEAEDKRVLKKALAMTLGAIGVAALITLIAVAIGNGNRRRGDGIEKSWNDDTASSADAC